MPERKSRKQDKLIIDKIINNNIISSLDADGGEMVIMGRGIGFGKKAGHAVDESAIEKIFKLDNQDAQERFKELLAALPLEYIQVSNDIISYAKNTLDASLNQNVYITLTDHIGFAIDRHKKGMIFQNALHEEVKLFYPREYTVGRHALYLIKARTGISLSDDEAASIALQLVNAEYNSSLHNIFAMTKMIHEMMEIIEQGIDSWRKPPNTHYRDRLIINLKYLGYRLLSANPENGYTDTVFYDFVKNHCAGEYQLIYKVNQYIGEQYGCAMTEEEQIYLALHIKRMKDIYYK